MGQVTTIVGVPCGTQARWAGFYDALLNLETVPGTVVRQVRGCSVAANRNSVVRLGLELGAENFFFLDDDLLFGPTVLVRLLARSVDAVVGLSLKRKPPFLPLIYDRQDDETGAAYERLLQPGEQGMVLVKAATSGGLLVKRRVFEAMSEPWWTLGQITGGSDGWGDDLHFCLKLRRAGFSLWCDLEVPFGHITEVVAWPMRRGDQWSTSLVSDVPFAECPPAGHPAWTGQAASPADRKGALKSWKA